MAGTATLTKKRTIGDVVKSVWHPGYNYVSGLYENHLGAAIDLDDPVGMPVKLVGGKWRSVVAGDEANVGGLLVYDKPLQLAAGATHADKFLVLRRGPALVNRDKIRTTDAAGAALNVTTVMTALNALLIIEQIEPTQTSTQTS